jgi:hypothetical protein
MITHFVERNQVVVSSTRQDFPPIKFIRNKRQTTFIQNKIKKTSMLDYNQRIANF